MMFFVKIKASVSVDNVPASSSTRESTANVTLASAFPQTLETPRRNAEVRYHYENTPIQIYRNFFLQKLRIFRLKKL